ncbi:MAG: DUF3347 domain-containing protein [Bacteroidota bacterium]|nr:DUF3347 domain-containing protein [Bacteroidota bacterium]
MKTRKSLFLSMLFAMTSVALFSCGDNKQGTTDETVQNEEGGTALNNNTEEFSSEKASMTRIIEAYLQMKNALVEDDVKKAKAAGAQMAGVIGQMDFTLFNETKQDEIQQKMTDVNQYCEQIANADLTEQRARFSEMSGKMLELIALTGADRTLYQQHCPMYNGGQGGTWLSDSEEVMNPLFGSQMLNCGSVTKTLATN